MSVWDDVKSQIRIEDVISDYVQVRQKGYNSTCLCPFHKEKTPSLIISSEKQIWHCFGCGLGGDVFAFVSMIENLDKKQTLEKLAARAGVKLNSSEKKEYTNSTAKKTSDKLYAQNNFERGLELLSWSSELYHQVLLKTLQDSTHPVTEYCRKRGLSVDIIKKFKLGLAPSKSIVSEKLNSSPENKNLARQIGLIK